MCGRIYLLNIFRSRVSLLEADHALRTWPPEIRVKHPLALFVLLAVLAAAAANPALAGESLAEDGYRLRLPSGFQTASSGERAAGARIRSRFGSMPIDGSPTVRVFFAGPADHPTATLSVARLDMKSPVLTHKDLGRRQIAAMEARVPEGFEFSAFQVGRFDAIQMQFSSQVEGEGQTSRVLSVACGDYVVVVLLETADARYQGAGATWDEVVESLEIVPRSWNLMLMGLLGLGALLLISLLARVARVYTRAGRQSVTRRTNPSDLVMPGARGSGPPSSEIRPPRRAAPEREGLLNTLPQDRR